LSLESDNLYMEARPRVIRRYQTSEGFIPFDDWFRGLKDPIGKKAVTDRLRRVGLGTLGHTDNVGEGVQGFKIDVGPGYRVYFGQDGPVLVVLLCGGEKHGQQRDIVLAQNYWRDYKSRKPKETDK